MDYYPLFIDLKQESCLVVGGGEVAARKANMLIEAGARVCLLAPQLHRESTRLLLAEKLSWQSKVFEESDVDGYRLVIAATDDAMVNRNVYRAAEARKILVNTVDDPQSCRFIVPAVVDRSPIQVAISSGGSAPVLARRLREQFESLLPTRLGDVASLAGKLRGAVKSKLSNSGERRRFWELFFSSRAAQKVLDGNSAAAERLTLQLLDATAAKDSSANGSVAIVGAGPGDPELLTLKALRLMQEADVVLYDELVNAPILDLIRRDAERVSVGKRAGGISSKQEDINARMIGLARQGKRVCRLKGGDPFVFGRGGEEAQALVAAGIAFQIVPGISAANGCASYAGIPLTHRDHADSVTFLTGHRKGDGSLDISRASLSDPRHTFVFYMGLSSAGGIAQQLIDGGLPSDTPAAAIENGTTTRQRVLVTQVDRLAEELNCRRFESPTLIIVGAVASLAKELAWFNKETVPLATITAFEQEREYSEHVRYG